MIQIKIIHSGNTETFEQKINSFCQEFEKQISILDIKYQINKDNRLTAMIIYNI